MFTPQPFDTGVLFRVKTHMFVIFREILQKTLKGEISWKRNFLVNLGTVF